MKEIQPITTWLNGQTIVANYMSLNCTSDNLIDTATFNYTLFSNVNDVVSSITSGTLTMTKPDYETDWNNNDEAWNWAAKTLNLTFAPTTTTSTTTI